MMRRMWVWVAALFAVLFSVFLSACNNNPWPLGAGSAGAVVKLTKVPKEVPALLLLIAQ